MNFGLMALITGALSFIGGVAGAFLSGYLTEKGKNRATHEDIEKLKEQVAAVTTTTEQIKIEISDAAWNRQKRWELKREVLLEAAKRLAESDDALLGDNGVWQFQELDHAMSQATDEDIRKVHDT